jgi:hypothetical protein
MEKIMSEVETGRILSVADDNTLVDKTGKFHLYYRAKSYDTIDEVLSDITLNQIRYSPSFYKPSKGDYGYRDEKNFACVGQFAILDVDSPEISSDERKELLWYHITFQE